MSKGHAGIGVGGQAGKERLKRRQPPGGSADADDEVLIKVYLSGKPDLFVGEFLQGRGYKEGIHLPLHKEGVDKKPLVA